LPRDASREDKYQTEENEAENVCFHGRLADRYKGGTRRRERLGSRTRFYSVFLNRPPYPLRYIRL
jgi:hypothetical protein